MRYAIRASIVVPALWALLAAGAHVHAEPPAYPVGAVPLFASRAGTPEAGVLAGLPAVQKLSTENLLFERKLRTNEAFAIRRDLTDLSLRLQAGGGRLADGLRLTLVGTMNREATIQMRLDTIDRELARRNGSR